MQGARSSGRLGVNPSRSLGYQNCPPGYVRTPDGGCAFSTPPSAQFPQGYPASAMVAPQIAAGPQTGVTLAVYRPSGMF